MIMRRFQKGRIFDHAQVSERVNFSIRRICQKRETEHMPERKVFSREMSPEKKEPDRAPFRSAGSGKISEGGSGLAGSVFRDCLCCFVCEIIIREYNTDFYLQFQLFLR